MPNQATATIGVAHRSKSRFLAIGAVSVLVCLYALFIAMHMGAYAGGSDSSGYMNSAWLFAHGAITASQRTIPGVDASRFTDGLYVPLGFELKANGRMAPTYSTGLPLVTAAVASVTGWTAGAPVTMFCFSMLGLFVTGWLAREWGLEWKWALLAVLLVGCSPLYLMYSLQLMSDLPAMVFTCAALTMAWKSRARAGWAAGAGMAFAAAVLTRHTNTLLLPALAVCLGLSWRRLLAFGLAGLPGGMFYCLYNHADYGHFFHTGYEGVGNLIQAGNVPPALLLYAWGLPVLLTPLALLAPGLPFLVRSEPRRATALILWVACLLGFYAFYIFTHETLWYLRFILPAFPALVVGSLMVLRRVLQTGIADRLSDRLSASLRKKFPPLLTVMWIIAVPVGYGLYRLAKYEPQPVRLLFLLLPPASAAAIHWTWCRLKGDPATAARAMAAVLLASLVCMSDLAANARLMWVRIGDGEAVYPKACAWANKNLPANSVICTMQTSGALFCYTSFTLVRWQRADPPGKAQIENVCLASGRPIYALLFPFEVERMRNDHSLDGWTQIASIAPVTCWRLELPRQPAANP